LTLILLGFNDESPLPAERVPVPFPHHGAEESGYAVLLMDPRSGIAIGLHHHEANPGQPFQESRTGLDHISVLIFRDPDNIQLELFHMPG
jgi:hypothetical protein